LEAVVGEKLALVRVALFPIERSGPGQLSTMARPRGGDWLLDEVEALGAAGVKVIVSLLTASEAAELGLDSESAVVTAAGMKFLSLPTPDRGVPHVPEFKSLLGELECALLADHHVAVHCRKGIGRSSLVAAGLLVIEGLPVAAAWASVARARGLDVPDTDEQKRWLATVTASS
jgi:protein-tyrosine phosphatase